MRTKLARWAALLLTIPAMLVVGLSTPANAASCSGYGCDNTDPIATGCSSNATTPLSGGAFGGALELRWGPGCQTNWTRFTPADSGTYSIWVVRRSPAAEGTHYTFSGGGAHYSDQLYAPGDAGACVSHNGQTKCILQSS
jgi:hypothetical protein